MKREELEAVKQFQDKFGAECCPPGTPITEVPDTVMELNKNLCVEEVQEARIQGVLGKSIEGLADGLGDTLYVLAHALNQLGRTDLHSARDTIAHEMLHGCFHELENAFVKDAQADAEFNSTLAGVEIIVRGIAAVYNIPMDEVFAEVHRSNMTKVWEDGQVRRNEFGKVIKPPTYSKANLAPILAGLSFD